MQHKLYSALVGLLGLLSFSASAQVKIFLMGSSTTAGSGASQDSSWAARLEASFRKNLNDNQDTTVVNVGYPGYVTYKGMPTGYQPPTNPDRTGFQPDTYRNITRAINEGFHLVILSYPSNDVNLWPNYTKKETMDNLRLMYQQLTANGIRTFVTTMQPRNDMSVDQRLWLRELSDSVMNNFGYYAINIFNDLVTNDGTNMLRADLTADNIHPNNTGHRLIYQRVAAKQLFLPAAAPLPVRVSEFRGQHGNGTIRLSWRSSDEDPGTVYAIQRSSNGRTFTTIGEVSGSAQPTYAFTDARPAGGANFYRLEIREPAKRSYSPIVSLHSGNKELFIQRLTLHGGNLQLEVGAAGSGKATVSIVSVNGAEVLRRDLRLQASGTTADLSVGHLPAGEYLLQLRTASASVTQRFIKAH